ncbi:MAG: phosphatase PAP2 family protein [Burkholderiaceae bacterium]
MIDTSATHARPPALGDLTWSHAFARRLVTLWPVKAIGTPTFLALFFWAYFAVLRHPLDAPFVVPEMAVDRWIPFTAASYPVYLSLWVYVSLPPALLGNMRVLLHYGRWMTMLCASAILFFWIFPTQTPAIDIDWTLYPSLSTIKNLDAAGNAFPSLHVASAVFSALWLDRVFTHVKAPAGLRWASLALCAAIAWSTLASRQHVMLDVLAGAAIGWAFALGSLRATRATVSPVQL